ncbi:MAG: sugar phosphate nucleotidyltransferase [Patescibacteria group bacterium]
MDFFPIIMAGGAGTRLWPVSRRGKPKQVYPLIDSDSLLQKTWKRLRAAFPVKNIFLATTEALGGEIQRQLPEFREENVSLEPLQRGTAAAFGAALLKVSEKNPRAFFVYVNADNFIRDDREFARVLLAARLAALKKPSHVVLVGVNPTYPETGYGYIKMGEQAFKIQDTKSKPRTRNVYPVFHVERFVEKPDLATAKQYLESWEYLWNPTLIVSRVDFFLGLYKKHLPAMWKELERMRRASGKHGEGGIRREAFSRMDTVSIDNGILEKEGSMLVLPADFGWTDVGHWRAVKDIFSAKPAENTIKGRGRYVAVESSGNLVYSMTGKLVATAGLHDCIIIETEDVVMVCPKDRAQDVKKIVAELEKKKLHAYL